MALLLGTDGYAALTINQADRMTNGLIETAEHVIDAYTGQSWLTGGTVTAERHEITNGRVWLKHRPITAVSAVRYGTAFVSPAVLTVTTSYVVDLPRGLITLCGYGFQRGEVDVDYTVPQVVPADISEAAGLLVVSWLRGQQQAAVSVGAQGLYKSVTVEGGTHWEYRDPSGVADSASVGTMPELVQNILNRHCRPVLA